MVRPSHSIPTQAVQKNRPLYAPVRATRLSEQVVDQIEKFLVAGLLLPGDRLPGERELAARFGVSRATVRQAIETLRGRRMVEAYSGRGTFVVGSMIRLVNQPTRSAAIQSDPG